MAKVTIRTTDGQAYEVDASAEDESFYDDLPFTSGNVLSTEIR
jgi:hypothetical protein